MLRKNNVLLIGVCFGVLLVSGCSSKEAPKQYAPSVENKIVTLEREEKKVFDPVMKNNSPSQKAIIDMGVVLKTHIVAYKDNSNNLMAGHDVFFWAIAPDFVTTNSLPKQKLKYSYKGPIVDLDKEAHIDLESSAQNESTHIERESGFDSKIEKFLHEQEFNTNSKK